MAGCPVNPVNGVSRVAVRPGEETLFSPSDLRGPPGREQRDEIGNLFRGQRLEVGATLSPGAALRVTRHAEVRPPGDRDAAQGAIADQGQERRVVEDADELVVLL